MKTYIIMKVLVTAMPLAQHPVFVSSCEMNRDEHSLQERDFLTLLSGRGAPSPSPAASARSGTRHLSRSSGPGRPAHRPSSVGVGRRQSHIFLQVNTFTGRPGLRLSWLSFRLWCLFCFRQGQGYIS